MESTPDLISFPQEIGNQCEKLRPGRENREAVIPGFGITHSL